MLWCLGITALALIYSINNSVHGKGCKEIIALMRIIAVPKIELVEEAGGVCLLYTSRCV